MKLTPGCAGDTWGRLDPGPDLRGLVGCVCVCVGGRRGGRRGQSTSSSLSRCGRCQEERKLVKGWRVGQGVDATSNGDQREML